jgi:uncharacterized protein YjcR
MSRHEEELDVSRIRQMWHSGHSIQKIADEYGVSTTTIRTRLGLYPKKKRYTQEMFDQKLAKELYKMGCIDNRIAGVMCVKKSAVIAWREALGFEENILK